MCGTIEETSIFGTTLRLRREIRSRIGENRIEIYDIVENAGFETAPLMLLYHFNFGFPLLDEYTTLAFPAADVRPRDDGGLLEGYACWQAPEQGCSERVYYHELNGNRNTALVTIRNPHFPLGGGAIRSPVRMDLSWDTRTLPRFVEWKMPAAGLYVLGIEPANCHVEGQTAERSRGTLIHLAPSETMKFQLKLEIMIETQGVYGFGGAPYAATRSPSD